MTEDGEIVELPLSGLGMAGAVLGEREIERLNHELEKSRADNTRLQNLLTEYMATPDDGIEVDTQRMQLRSERQPCGHPVQAIRHGIDVEGPDGAVSNWCGWCQDVGQLEADIARLLEAFTNCEHNLHGVASEQRRAWTIVIRLREVLRWAVPQMRRAARTIELFAVGARLDEADNYYSLGLDDCADSCEAAIAAAIHERESPE